MPAAPAATTKTLTKAVECPLESNPSPPLKTTHWIVTTTLWHTQLWQKSWLRGTQVCLRLDPEFSVLHQVCFLLFGPNTTNALSTVRKMCDNVTLHVNMHKQNRVVKHSFTTSDLFLCSLSFPSLPAIPTAVGFPMNRFHNLQLKNY